MYLISDHHFSHANILKFQKQDGTPIRPGYSSIEEMDELLIERHNKTVKSNDKVYFLGDVTLNRQAFNNIIPRLNGHKRLILGNHDNFSMLEYTKYFEKIFSAKYHKGKQYNLIFCHYPLHLDANAPKKMYCVHGHIHEKLIFKNGKEDTSYINMCVEHNNGYPQHIDQIIEKIKRRDI